MDLSRLELQADLEDILGSDEVHFQPPDNLKMKYPAIVYEWDDEDVIYANNIPYRRRKRYSVTVITRDPDDGTPDKVGAMPLSSFGRRFVVDQLYHTNYNVFF